MVTEWQYFVLDNAVIGSKVCGISAAIILSSEGELVWSGPIYEAVFG